MKHKLILGSAAVLALACFAGESAGQTARRQEPSSKVSPATNSPSPVLRQKVAEEYGRLPLSFEANQGQSDPKVKFLSRGPGYQLFLLPDEAVLTLRGRLNTRVHKKDFKDFRQLVERPEHEADTLETIRMSLLGAAAHAQVTGAEEMPGKSNYFIGNDPSQWRTSVPNYAKVRYHGVYPGIDLVYHGSRQQLEYDFIVSPGADPRRIRLALHGAKKLELTSEGDLLLSTSGEPVRLHKPVIYQELGGKRKPIDGSFVLVAKNTVRFRIGKYDTRHSLIIDPVLAYSTLLGGNGFDQAFSIAVDSTGAAYVTGTTTSTNLATPGAFQTALANCGTPAAFSPCEESFVAKLNPAGNSLAYVTYLGGTGFTEGAGVAVFAGNAYVMGTTTAKDFPTTPGAFQSTLPSSQRAFVTELNATGAALVFSTYLGGTAFEFTDLSSGPPIAVDSSGNAYVTGTTESGDFPTTPGAFQADPGGGAFRSADGSATWTASVTGLTSRSITAFVVDPTVPTTHIVYAGTSDKELFKSTNGGQSWVSASGNGATSLSANVVQALVIDPRTPANLYVGGANGTFKTTDGGATWAAVDTGLVFPGTATPVDVRALAIDPTTTGTTATLYAGGFEGAFKTTNGGASWTSLNAGFPLTNGLPTTPEITSIVVDPLNPSTVYAGVEFPGGVFKSSDGGATWTAVSNGLVFPNTTSPLNIRTLAIDVKAPASIYATTFNGVGVYKTSNGGLNWGAVNNGLTDLQINGIAVDSTVSGTLYVGTQSTGVFKTVDGGANWTTATNALSNFIVGSLAVDPVTPTNVYAGSSVERTYVAKFSSSGAIGYATYLGGSSMEFAGGIAVDSFGSAYVTGLTESRNFPTTPGAFRTTRQSAFDAYVTKLNAAGLPVYSTYLDNPNGFSEGFGIAVDSQGGAYVTGVAGPSFPTTPGAFQTVNPTDNAFVTKLSPDGTALVYSTFLGGQGGGGGFAFTEGRVIAVDTNGNAWVTGITEDFSFPTVNPIRASFPCVPALSSSCFFFSPFVSEVKSDGSSLLFSTYLGPTQFFTQGGIAVDSQGNAYVAGNTSFAEFPMVNPLPGTPSAGNVHGFVTKIATGGASTDLSITLNHSPDPVTIGQNITFTSTIKNNNPPGGASATGVTFYPTQVPNSTIHLFKTLAAGNLTNPATTQGTCDANEFCSIGTLAPGVSATVTMVVSTFAGQEGIQTVAVGVGGNESDPTPANNTATTTVNVLGAVDLQLVATASPAPVLVGNNLTYQLIVTNTAGPSPATGVVLTDTLPSGVNFVPAASTPGCAGTTTIVCALGTLPVGGTAVVNIVVTPTVAGTITNNSVVTSNEVNNSAGKNVFKQVSDVIAPPNTANNAKLNGHYAFLFQGAEADSLMAFAGSFIADGNGNLTNGISDTNATSGLLINQSFTGTYNVGPDNRGTMIITITGGAPQTYRFALGAFNAQNVATKARFIDFDAGRKGGAGLIEMQDSNAFSAAAIKGNFAFGVSGENGNASHFAAAGRFTTDGVSLITGGQEDADTAGVLNTNLAFSGTYNVPLNSQNGRGAVAFTFTGPGGGTLNFAVYLVSANEAFVISTDQRSPTVPLSSGQALRQQTSSFSNSWLNGKGVFNLSGTPTGNTETHVTVGLATTDGFGNIAVLSDENDGGLLILNHTGSTTAYSVTSTGRTTFTGGTSNPVLYLVDLNRGFLVGTDVDASTGSLEPQVGGPFSNASTSGSLFLGSLTPNALSVGPFIGEGSTDGAGNFVATEDGVTPTLALFSDAVFTDTFVVSPNGRAVSGSGSVSYLVSPGRSFGIGAKSGKTNDLVSVSESSALLTADLALTKSASVSNAVVGEQFSYTLTVKNNGPGPATGVLVTDLLPATVTFASASASQGICTGPSPVLCSLGAIPNGASVDIFIVVTAVSAGSAGNTASVTANEPDPNLVNNTESSGPVNILSFTDLAVGATATPDSVIVNSSNLTFTITVTNVGNLSATNIVVTDTLPAGVTVIGLPTGCSQVSNTLTCNLGTSALAGGGTVILRIGIMPTTVGTITHTATVTFTEQASDPTPNDNTASASATVLPAAGTSERYLLTDRNSPTVLEFNTASTITLGTAHAGSTPEGVAISPNGRLAFVGNLNSNYVSVIDLTLNAEIARIRGVRASRHLTLNGDGTKLVVPNINTDEVDIIDTSTFQILSRVSINGLVGDDPNNPNDIGNAGVVTAGNFAYINTNNNVTAASTRIAVIDLTTFAASSIPGTGVGLAGARDQIAATPDGKWVVVPRRGPAALLIIDAARNVLSQTVNLVANPFAITITRDANDPNGVFGYVTTRAGAVSAVSVLDLRSGSVTFGQLLTGAQVTIPAPLNPSKIGITADGTQVIVTSFSPTAAQNNVFVLDTRLLRTTPASSIVAQFRAGGALPSLDGIAVGLLQSQAPANAPVVSTVTPTSIVNDVARQVHITGSGFATGALVRVGSLDPIAAVNVSTNALDVTLPQFTPAQNLADVIVTNPSVGGVDGQWTSGILPGALTISSGAAFQPANEVTVSDFGDNAVGIFNNATKSVTNVSTSPRPLGEAISVDGLRAYVGSLTNQGTAGVNVINLNSKTLEATIPLAADTFIIGQTDAIVTAPNPATGGPAEFLLTGYTNAVTALGDLRVVLIDSDSTSPTFNTIVASFNAGLTTDAFPGALAVTSDGHFAYANDGNTGNLVVFNLLAGGAATVVPVSALSNANVFQGHFDLTQDNKSLILVSTTGSMLVFDIGANPISPALVTTITGTPPASLQPLSFGAFHVVGKRLYAYDTQGVLQAFNFDRTAVPANFSVLGSVAIPGVANLFGSGLGVTPDGALLYAALDQEDSVAVLDTTQLVASSPSALITKIRVGLTPSAIVISPAQALVAALAITKTAVPTTVTVGTPVTYTMTVTNSGPSASSGVTVTDVLPTGLTFVSATPSQGSCSGTTTITCSLGQIANGASASVSITATVTAAAASTTTNTATVAENETNSTPASATASVNITVTGASVCTGTIRWTGSAGDGQWTTPTNWDQTPARIPAAADDVCIDTSFAGTTVTLANSQQSVHSLTAASNFVLANTSATTSLTVAINSVFLNSLTLNGATLSSAGNLALDGLFTSSGTSSIGGTTGVRANAGLTVSGTLTVIRGSLANFGPGTLTLGSVIQLSGGATLDNNSSLSLTSANIQTSSGSSVVNRAGATINNISGVSTISAPVTNLGTVSISNSGVLGLNGGYTQSSGATVLNNGSAGISTSSPLNINGGLLAGTGVITGSVTLGGALGGTLSPGFSPGKISLTGVYTQNFASTYNAEIGGLTAGTQYDQIAATPSGSAAIGGTLNVSLINGFVPVAGNSFVILTCTAPGTCLTGTFSTVNVPALPNGLRWNIAYSANSVVLSVTATAAGCASGTNQWTGTAGDNLWATPGNWSVGVPVATDNICIGTAFTGSTITIGPLPLANQTIASLVANSTINFTSGPLSVTGAATFANALNINGGGTLTLNGTSTVQGATTLSGGTLTGTGSLTLSGLLTWNAGAMAGAGTTTANGGIAVSFISAGAPTLGRTLTNNGTATFNANPLPFSIVSGGNFINSIGSTMDIQTDGVSVGGGGNTGTLTNAGTIMKSGGTGAGSSIDVNLSSTGPIQVKSGTLTIDTVNGLTSAAISGATTVSANSTLNFNGVGATVSGAVSGPGSVSASFSAVTFSGAYFISGTTTLATVGTTLNFNGPAATLGPLTLLNGSVVNFNASGTVTGIGAVTISGSTANFSSGTTTINLVSLALTQGGVLTGTNNLTIAGTSALNQGTISGTGTITANGPVAFNVPPFNFPLVLDARTFTANASVTMTSTAPVQLQNGAVFVNSAVSLFDIQGPAGITFGGGAAATFNNLGAFQRSAGAGAVPVAVAFNNSGTVSANAGALNFSSGGTGAGAFNVTSGATLGFTGGTFTLSGSISGAGALTFAPNTATLSGAYNVTGGTTVSGGTVHFTGPLPATGPLTINGGTADFTNIGGSIATAPTITLSSGTLTGADTVSVTGLLTWTGGTMGGPGITNANGGMSIPLASVSLDTRTLNVLGTTTFGNASGGGHLFLSNGAVVNNSAGATWTIVNGALGNSNGILFNGGTAPTFNNAGTFQMTGGTFNTISVAFNNTGTVNANAGTLSFTGPYTQTAGVTRVNGGTLSSTQVLNVQGGTLLGVDVAAPPTITAPINNSGGILHPGLSPSISPGVLSTSGPFTQGANGSFNVDISGTTPGTGFSQMNVAGPVTLNGTLNVTLSAAFTPASGNTFTILTCSGSPNCLTGTFATTNFITLPPGLTSSLAYNPNSVVLSVVSTTGADLAITKTASVSKAPVSATFTYTLTVTNNGPLAATGVAVSDPLPAQVLLSAPPTTNVGACNTTAPIACNIGNLANGASATISVPVQATTIGTATNTASVTGGQTDPNPGNNSATATVLVVGTADLQITKTAQPSPVNVGSNLTYTLTVINNGPNQATGVTVTDTLPASVTFVSANTSQGTCSGTTTITCNLGNLAVGGVAPITATVTIVVTPTTAGSISNTASVASNEVDQNAANNTSTANVTVNAAADLAVTATATPNPDGLGNPLNVVVTVTNNGPSPATGVTLSNSLPAGSTLTSATPSQGTCNAALTCALGNLAKGASATLTLVLNPTAVGNLTDTATVSANETDPVANNNTASATVPITASSDLAVTQTVTSPILFGTANVVYRVTVTNNGPSQADNITLTDVLTGNIVDESISTGAVCSENPAFTFSCVFSLPSGASQQFTVVAPPTAAGTFTNAASVSSANFDANPANNTSTASAIVNPSVDLSLTVNAPQAAFVGNTITFAYTIQNNQNSGLSNATGVTLTDTLPNGLSFVPSSSSPVCSGTATITCNVGALAKGATANVSIVVRVDAAGKFTNTASVSATEPDLFPSNNTAINTFAATASADLAIAITFAPATPAVGVNLTFTITVANNGPSPATGILAVGAFTTGATIVSITPSQGLPCTGTTQFNCNLGALASGSSAKIIAVVTPTVGGQFGTTVSVEATELDPNPANNSQTVLVNVISAPTVTLSASNVTFASQPVGTSSTPQIVTLTNASPALPITSLVIAPSGDFSETDNCGTGLAPLAFCNISITFKPSATGTRTGAITLTDNALGSPQMIALTGSGIVAPAITLSPGSLVFSSRLVGTSSSPLPVSLTNSGNATLNIASIAITGTNAGDFSQTNTCGSTLGAGLTCTINVVFKPTDGGQRTAGVAITSDARGSVPVVTLSGTGLSIGLGLSSSLLIFDSQTVGTTSPAQTVTLSNASASAIAISSITITGDYAQTNNCGSSVAASSSCSIQITFTPTLTGSRPGTLSVAAADSANPHTVTLSGTGAVVTLSLSPTSLTFADQTVGTSSQAQGILLTNTGATALTISSIVPSGDFLESNTCGAGLAAGANCTISVTFVPTGTGTRAGSITITSNAQGSPHTVKLTGNGVSTGPAVSLSCPAGAGAIVHRAVAGRTAAAAAAASSCTSLSFPAQAVGAPSTPLTVVLTNAGNAPLTGIGVSATGDFAASSACVSPLAPAASCNISVTFTPTDTGTRAGSLTIQDNAGDSPQSLLLNGTGTPSGPAVTLSTTALPFGNQLLGTTSSPAQTVTVSNTGTATLTFTSIKASGDFAETDNCSAGVPANSSCTISVTFTPTATGARAGAITISDNAPANPQSVTLSGEGTDIAIAPPPGSSTSASLAPGQMATFPLSIAPSGGFNGPVTVTCTSAIPAGTCNSSPSSFTLDSVVTVTTTVTTTAPSKSVMMMLPDSGPRLRTFPRWLPRNVVILRALAQSLVALLALLMFALAVRRRRRGWLLAVAGLFLFALASGISGCAGGSGNPGVVGQTSGTPAGTYTVTVVVKTSTGATRSLPLTITVH